MDRPPDDTDLGVQAHEGPPDLGPRLPWRAVSPTPEDSNLQGVFGTSESDYYLLTSDAILHRQSDKSSVLWRAAAPACLRGLAVTGTEVFAAGGCSGVGQLVRRNKSGVFSSLELPNLILGGLFARSADEVFVASPSAGVLYLQGGAPVLERTASPGELGAGPVAVWGTASEVFAVGNGRILRRRGAGQWDTERSAPGEIQLGVWGAGADDLYVVGATDGVGAIWHRIGLGMPFRSERIDGAAPQAVRAVFGHSKDEVYAAADFGMVLRRDPVLGSWSVDRTGATEHAAVRALWGAGPGHLLAAGPGGLVRRKAGATWDAVLGQSLTGVTLRALSLTSPRDGFAVGQAGVVLHQKDGRWTREAQGLSERSLAGVAATADGTAYAVGERGLVLRRDREGAWAVERTDDGDGGAADTDLYAVALDAGGAVFAVGASGRILERQGGVWQAEPPLLLPEGPLRAALRAVAVLPDGMVVVAGDAGTVLWRPRGAARFSLVRSEPNAGISYTGLSVLGQELWISASGGAVILRLAGGQLRKEASPIAQASAIYGTGTDDVYLAGRDGAVWHWDGWIWQAEPLPSGEPLLALVGSGDGVLASGDHGFLVQRP